MRPIVAPTPTDHFAQRLRSDLTTPAPCTARPQWDWRDTARSPEILKLDTLLPLCASSVRRYQGAAACIRTGGLRRLLVPTKFFPSPCRGIAAARRGASSHKFQRPICAELHSPQERLEQTQAAGVLRDERSHPASRLVPDRSFGSTG